MEKRREEIDKYVSAYKSPHYRMGVKRKEDVTRILNSLTQGSLLDVGTGRGETVELADRLGFSAMGTEVVPGLLGPNVHYSEAHNLLFEDNQFDYVTCFDVLEHLVEEDVIQSLREMARVSIDRVIVSAADFPHTFNGVEMHISYRSAEEWRKLLESLFPRVVVNHTCGGSPCFTILTGEKYGL